MTASEDDLILSWVEFMALPVGSKVRARNGMVYEFAERTEEFSRWTDEQGANRSANSFVLPVRLVHRA